MAKGKKTKQPDVSKKNVQKKKAQSIEDQTFGLKNKKNSKVVQRKVTAIEKSVVNGGDRRQNSIDAQRARQKQDNKLRKKAVEDERNALFGEALMAIKGKKAGQMSNAGKLEAKGRDADEDTKKSGTSRAMKMMFQMDAQEMEARLKEDPNYVPTLEDEVESQRQKKVAELKASGKGTPVTEESFAAWQDRKRKRKLEANKKLVDAEMKKKKGGKGLGVLSGRALYEFKQELFADKNTDGVDLTYEKQSPEEQDAAENEIAMNGDDSQYNKDLFSDDATDGLDFDEENEVDDVAEKVDSDLTITG